MAEPAGVRLYRYRWVVLGAFALLNAVVQANWITFAPVTDDAAAFYGVSDLRIGLLSMVFMVVFVVVSIPASYVIDTYGLRVGVGIGALLTGGFALTRGLFGDSYGWVFASQVGLAVGQPFVMNAITKVGRPLVPPRTSGPRPRRCPRWRSSSGSSPPWRPPRPCATASGCRACWSSTGSCRRSRRWLALALIRERPATPAGRRRASRSAPRSSPGCGTSSASGTC